MNGASYWAERERAKAAAFMAKLNAVRDEIHGVGGRGATALPIRANRKREAPVGRGAPTPPNSCPCGAMGASRPTNPPDSRPDEAPVGRGAPTPPQSGNPAIKQSPEGGAA